jgi:epoxyqueuosine reductase
MNRARLRGLKRNSSVLLGDIGTTDDVPLLLTSLDPPEPLARAHAAWALRRIGADAVARLRERLVVEADRSVRHELASAIADLEE